MGTIAEGPADASRAVDTFYESEAALQLVCSELDALRMDDAHHDGADDARAFQQAALVEALPFILRRASEQVTVVLDGLRLGRASLARAAQGRRGEAGASAQPDPEVATDGIMSAFDRALRLLDELGSDDDGEAGAITRGLRAEVLGMVTAMRADERVAEVAGHAGGVLFGAELKLVQARWTLDPRALVSWRDVARSDRTDRDSRPVAPPADPSLAQ